MSSDGNYQTRASRRVDRERPPSQRASAGSATAILIMAVIIGFGGGAIAGAMSSGDTQTPTTANGEPNADAGNSPDSTPDESDENNEEPDAQEVPEGAIVAQSTMDGQQARAGTGSECGDCDLIEFTITTEPPLAGETVWLERSVDGGAWEPFGSNPRSVTLNSNGSGSDSVWSGRAGENRFRWVLRDGGGGEAEVSNEIVVTLVPQD